MVLLLTGGSGFLGYHLQQQLKKQNISYVAPSHKEMDLTDKNSTYAFFKQTKPTKILHGAAKCAGILGNVICPADFISDNALMGLNIYSAALKYNVKQIFSIGTACMYSYNAKRPFREDRLFHDGEPEKTNKNYADAKRLLLGLSEAYRTQHNIGGAFFIPANLYGIADTFDNVKSHVIPALIKKMVDAQNQNLSSIECYGSGKETSREFLNAKECAEILIKCCIEDFDYPTAINLGTSKEITIFDLAHLIKELVGFKGEITWNGLHNGQKRRCLSIEKAKKILNWEAKIDLKTGLQEVIEWYRNNY